ncbi:MAG: hypothetical protein ABI452_02815, partial [Candidatus Limnocylindrales bacterium]
VESDGTPRNFYDSAVNITDPDLTLREGVRLTQVAPGVYETDLGTLTPGAYAMRFVQTKPGDTPLARTVMLVAPTPAEYRLLGTNERLLAALRSSTNGRELSVAKDAWTHDLGTTTASTDMVPWLLLLALLLWPLDVGIRRVSVSRGDVGLARAWTAARWRAWRGPARRTQQVGEMLATKGRAGGAASRAALLRSTDQAPTETVVPTPPPAARPAPAPASAEPVAPPPSVQQADTIARLRDAKQRARDRETRDHS